jgi:serine/threonine protein kinase
MAFTQGTQGPLTLHFPPKLLEEDKPKLPSFVKEGNPLDDYPEDDVEEIAWGTFGTVYQVKLPNGTFKAVKALNALPHEKEKIQKALKEAQIVLGINHPNILPIEEVWYDGSRFFFIMDFITPISLGSLSNPKKQKILLFQQLVLTVSYLFSQRILHRDIKLENTGFTLDEDGKMHLFLFDFGEACHQVSDHYLMCVGSVLNFSPEVVNFAQYSDRSEVWALICYLVELLESKTLILEWFNKTQSAIKSEIDAQKNISSLKVPPILDIFKEDKSASGLLLLQILERGLAINPAERLTFPELERLLQELIALL